jgi:acyl-coenzyme A thioesterase PaaI-like protein
MVTEEATLRADDPKVVALRGSLLNPLKLSAWMLAKLPLALIAGLRVTHADERTCQVTVPYGWRSQNPFRSTYFAALAMAAEMSTGVLGLTIVQSSPKPISMLITSMQADFVKKATDVTTFTCEAGEAFAAAVSKTLADGEPVTVTAESIGRNEAGLEVARFSFTWSFKRKS